MIDASCVCSVSNAYAFPEPPICGTEHRGGGGGPCRAIAATTAAAPMTRTAAPPAIHFFEWNRTTTRYEGSSSLAWSYRQENLGKGLVGYMSQGVSLGNCTCSKAG